MNNQLVELKDLKNNPTHRVPVCLCLDTSGSMGAVTGNFTYTGKTSFLDGKKWDLVDGGTSRIFELQQGVSLFFEAIKEDGTAKYAAEISIVTFDDTAKCLMDFTSLEDQRVPELTLGDNTSMGEGVNLALDLLEKRKQMYHQMGITYYQPWLVLMTDGEPNGNPAELDRAISRTVKLVKDEKLSVFPIGIGEEADMAMLNRFSPARRALKVKELKFREFFDWLSGSLIKASQSGPGEKVKLDVDSIQGWGEL